MLVDAASTTEEAPSADSLNSNLLSAPSGGAGGGAMAPGGELPLFTRRTFGVIAIPAINWVVLGSIYSLGLPVFQAYLNAPANVVVAISVLFFAPNLFVIPIGMLSDCVPICGSRRKAYMYVGVSCVAIAMLLIVLMPYPAPYYCHGLSNTSSVCNPDAPSFAGPLMGMIGLATFGTQIVSAASTALIIDYAQREELATRGRIFSYNTVATMCGAGAGTVFVGVCLNSIEYGGAFSWALGFPGVAATFLCLQLPQLLIIHFATHELPLPGDLAAASKIATVRASLGQTADALRNSFVVRVLVFHLLLSFSGSVNPPSDYPIQAYWTHVTPLSLNLSATAYLLIFSAIITRYAYVLPNWSWRTILLVTELVGAALMLGSNVLIALDICRSAAVQLLTAFAAFKFNQIIRMLVASFVIAEVSAGANQATLNGLFVTFDALGPPLARAVAEPLFATFKPSLASAQSYIDDTPAFRRVIIYGYLVYTGFSLTLLVFIRMLPDSKLQAQKGMRAATHRQVHLYGIVGTLILLLAFALVMTIAPLVPALACVKFLGGRGC